MTYSHKWTLIEKLFIFVLLFHLPFSSFSSVYTVYEGGLSNHSDPNNPLSLQYRINNAQSGDEIILGSNKSYIIRGRIILKNGIILRGKRDQAGFKKQNILAADNFPPDLEMILVYSGNQTFPTVVKSVRFKGNNKAWRIARTTAGGEYYVFDNCRMEDTKNDFTQSDENYTSNLLRKRFYDVSLIYCKNSNHVTINNCTLINAGLNQNSGKKNPYAWKGFGSGIRFQYCDNVTVTASRIERTLTEGIRLSGCKQVLIDDNTLVRTGMNREWYDKANNHKGVLASGITGYHNQGENRNHYGGDSYCAEDNTFDFSWVISNNRFYWIYNNAISVSGNGIKITGNRSNYAYQNALFLGDWRKCSNGEGVKENIEFAQYGNECTRNIEVVNNDFENSYYADNNWSWVFNTPNDSKKSTAVPAADIRINGYDESVYVYSNKNSSIFWEPDNTCSCTCLSSAESRNVPKLAFEVFQSYHSVALQWLTNSGYKATYFEIEHSTNGKDFTKVNRLLNKDSSERLAYHEFIDVQPVLGDNFYRLKEIYSDGSFVYSEVQQIKFNIPPSTIPIFPNPAQEELFIGTKTLLNKLGTINLVNQFGQVVFQQKLVEIESDILKINTSEINNGLYYLIIAIDQQKTITKKVLIHRLY